MRVAGNFHERGIDARHGIVANSAGGRVETAQVAGGCLGEPDVAGRINGDAVGIERGGVLRGGQGVLLYVAIDGVEPAEIVGVEFGEPDVAVAIDDKVVWRAGSVRVFPALAGSGVVTVGSG